MQTVNYNRLPPPMRIGQLMDRVFRLLPQLIRPLIFISVVVAGLTIFSTYINLQMQQGEGVLRNLALLAPVTILQWVLYYYFMVLTIFLSDDLWVTGATNSVRARARATFGSIIRSLLLGWSIMIGTMLWCLLFIIPGLIYFINRAPALNILLIENLPIKQSLKKSKMLMTHYPGIPWWSFETPMMRISAIMLVSMILNLMPAILSGTNSFLSAFHGQTPNFTPVDYLLTFFSTFLTLIFSTFGYLAGVGFYYDLLVRAQGVDLENEIASLTSA